MHRHLRESSSSPGRHTRRLSGSRQSPDPGSAARATDQARRSSAAKEDRADSAARHLRPAEDAVGRSGHRRRLQQQRRERHPLRAARRVCRPPHRGLHAGRARQAGRAAAAADHRAHAGAERVPGRDEPDALVRELLRRQQPAVARHRSGRRQGAAADGRGAAAARPRAQAARKGRGPADSWEDRSLYDRCITRGIPGSMMPAIYGNSYHIQQGPGFVTITYEMVHDTRVIPLDGRPHIASNDPPVHGRCARPLGRQHARRRDHELHRQDAVSRIERPAADRRALHADRSGHRGMGGHASTIRIRGRGRGRSR